jgi:signal transduction histidine kinase
LKQSQATLEKQVADLRKTVRRLDPSAAPEGLKLALTGAHIKGSATAPVTIVEFSDYQ